jgi:hypothetical protein
MLFHVREINNPNLGPARLFFRQPVSKYWDFNCCLSVHVDNYTIIIPTKCARFLLLKAQDITICPFLSCIFAPTCFNPRGSFSGGSMPVPG